MNFINEFANERFEIKILSLPSWRIILTRRLRKQKFVLRFTIVWKRDVRVVGGVKKLKNYDDILLILYDVAVKAGTAACVDSCTAQQLTQFNRLVASSFSPLSHPFDYPNGNNI